MTPGPRPRRASRSQRRRRRRLDRQLPVIAAALARSVHAGATLPGALEQTADSVEPPGLDGLEHVRSAIGRGVPVEDALAAWERAERHGGVTLLVTAARLGYRHGGDLGAALDAVSVSLLDRVDVADEARALSSQARSSAAVLVALPPFGAACFCLLDPAVARTLLGTPLGWCCIVAGAGLDAAGAWVMQRMVDGALR